MDIQINTHRIRFSKDPKSLSRDKATIIFLHDSLGCIDLWKDFPEKVTSITDCNVIAYDRQGYGKSEAFSILKRDRNYLKKEAEFLGKIIETLHLKNVILFGHSDGGSIALLTAALFPEKINGIIAEGAHVFVEAETINGIKEAVLAYNKTNLKEKLSKYHGDKTDGVFKMWTETWLSASFQTWNIEKHLPHIKCPSLIIQGEKDEYGSIAQVNAIVQNTSGNSRSLIIPEIGHTPHKENPEIVLKETADFICNILTSC